MIYFTLLIVTLLYHSLLGGMLFIAIRRGQPGKRLAWLLLAVAALVGYQVLIYRHMQPSPYIPPNLVPFAVLQFLVLAALLWFCGDFPASNHRFRVLAILLLLLGMGAVAYTLLVPAASVIVFPTTSYNVKYHYNPLLLLWLFAAWLAVLVRIGSAWARTRGLTRTQLGVLFAFTVQVIVPVVLAPLYREYDYQLWLKSWLMMLALATTMLASAFTVDMVPNPRHLLLRSGLPSGLATMLLATIFYTVTPHLAYVLFMRYQFSMGLTSLLCAIGVSVAFQPLRRLLAAIMDRLLCRVRYSAQAALSGLGAQLASTRSRDAALRMLANTLRQTLAPRTFALYLAEGASWRLAIGSEEALPVLEADDLVVTYAAGHQQLFTVQEFGAGKEFLWTVGEQLHALHALVAVPLLAPAGLCGLLFLGEKSSSEAYTPADLEFLTIFGAMANLALARETEPATEPHYSLV